MKQVTVRAFRGMARNETYGELNSVGRKDLISFLREEFKNKPLSFLDIGSGFGILNRDVAEQLEVHSYGVEINSKKYLKCLSLNHSSHKELITFIKGDIKEHVEIFDKVNCVYTNNIMFTEEDNKFIFKNYKGILISNNYSIIKSLGINYETIPLNVTWTKVKNNFYKTNTFN